MIYHGWSGATNDVGAPENRINVLKPRDSRILPVFGPLVIVHLNPKKARITLLYLEPLSMRNGWRK
jgi:hypothetical protein